MEMRKVLILSILAFSLNFPHIATGWERNGTIDISDCREVITLSPDTWRKYWNDFTCTYSQDYGAKSKNCYHVETYGGLLVGSGKCKTVYEYSDFTPADGCAQANPYLVNGMCYGSIEGANVAEAALVNSAAPSPAPTSTDQGDSTGGTLAGLVILGLIIWGVFASRKKARKEKLNTFKDDNWDNLK